MKYVYQVPAYLSFLSEALLIMGIDLGCSRVIIYWIQDGPTTQWSWSSHVALHEKESRASQIPGNFPSEI